MYVITIPALREKRSSILSKNSLGGCVGISLQDVHQYEPKSSYNLGELPIDGIPTEPTHELPVYKCS